MLRTQPILTSPRFAITLTAALLQGLLLLWLHTRIESEAWPTTAPHWLAALYAVGVFIPLTIHLLSEHWRNAFLWISLTVLAAVYFYFGWHFGANVGSPFPDRLIEEDTVFPFAVSLSLLWLLILPFLRARLATGRWRTDYAQLFTLAWQNKIALAEAALFTGVLWLLLALWAKLFKMLGYEIFEDFFSWRGFIYPFTAMAFAVALHLVGSVERIVTVAREQLLGLLKWLTPVAALILALFAPTLLVKLPNLIFSGEHAIGAAWLLWLLAVTVLLLNAGYQNGRVEKPYPAALALALRIVVPAMLIVAATALYALYVRMAEYGITVERVFAAIVGLAALAYSLGYTIAAVRRGPWLRGIERVNIGVALGLILVIGLTLTPLASPYRLAAASQSARAIASANDFDTSNSALRYLRFEAGRYGTRALQHLANVRTAKLREHAAQVLKLEHRWAPDEAQSAEAFENIEVFPKGHPIEPALAQAMRTELKSRRLRPKLNLTAALFIDLNADGLEEGALLIDCRFVVFTRRDARWIEVGSGHVADGRCDESLRTALAAGAFAAQLPQWRDLRIGDRVLPVNAQWVAKKALELNRLK